MDELIMGQTSNGYWDKIEAIQSFFAFDVVAVDNEITNEVKHSLVSVSEFEKVWLTLLALFILKTQFKNKQQEWTLISTKAKTFLK